MTVWDRPFMGVDTASETDAPAPPLNLIEDALRRRGPRLCFVDVLETRYRRDMAPFRARLLRQRSRYFLIVYLAIALIVSLIPGHTRHWGAIGLQAVGMIALTIVAMPYFRAGMVFWKREAAQLAFSLGLAVSVIDLGATAPASHTLAALIFAAVPLHFLLVLLRPGFRAGVTLAVVTIVAFGTALCLQPAFGMAERAVLPAALAVLAIPMLTGHYQREQAARQAYLFALSSRLKIQAAAKAVPPPNDPSLTDPLTGAGNRRLLETTLRRICDREDTCGSLLMIDIDWFKDFNDFFGHTEGDRCLQEMATCLMTTLREGDLLCRIGGEEFALLLPALPMNDAIMVAERLRAVIASYPFMIGTRIALVTISIGVAGIVGFDDPARVLAAAEEALMRAKRAGRNQVGSSATKRM